MRKRILLFGGGGFLGTNLLTGLCANCDVVCLDRGRRYGSFGNLSRSVRLVKGAIEELAVLCREMSFDHLFYLAGGNAARLTGEQRDTETESARRSLEATLEILATTGKGTVLTYFSSYLCYASSAQRLTERSPTCDTAYARLHLTNERSVCESGVPNMIIRLSTVYGRYGITNALQTGGVVGKFVSAMSEGKPIRLNNAGRDGMDFLHTSDFVRACAQIVDRPQTTGVFNLGSERQTSVLRLAQILDDALCAHRGIRASIVVKDPAPDHASQSRHCATTRFQKAFAWSALRTVEEQAARLLVEELAATRCIGGLA